MAGFHQAFFFVKHKGPSRVAGVAAACVAGNFSGEVFRPIKAGATRGRGECNRGAGTPCLVVTRV
jgi:hypothetical protein